MRTERRRAMVRSITSPLALLSLVVAGTLSLDVRAQESATEPASTPLDAADEPDAAAPPASVTTDDDAAPSFDDTSNSKAPAADDDGPSPSAKTTSPDTALSTTEEQGDAATTTSSDNPPLVEASLDPFRTPVDRLTEHYLGSTSRPVRFDWRNSLFILGVHGGELIERNNFGSFRLGAVVRRAFLSIMFEAAASYVFVIGTESSELLALTPYRQASRPPRVELDVNVSYPLFEGVVTPIFDFIPASEMVFSVTGGGRYLLYPQTIIGDRNWDRTSTWTDTQTWQDIGAGLATAQLLDDDRRLLERRGLPGMQIDPATVHTLAGFTFDAYYQPGLFFSARALLAIPALYLVSGTRLGFWWETTLVAGWAF